MPLPINWIAIFVGITVPYIVLLVAIGLPFNHTLVWLYVLPPGLLTWLTTRPVIENKRLPELVESQVRYLAEPRVWCRLSPLSEKDHVVVVARVWHSRRAPQPRKTAVGKDGAGAVALRERGTLVTRRQGVTAVGVGDPAEGNAPLAAASALVAAPATAPVRSRSRARDRGTGPRVPNTSGGHPAGRRTRPSRDDWAARQRQAAQQARSLQETSPGQQAHQQAQGNGQEPTTAAPAHQGGQAAKPARFRLAALRSRSTGPAPALPPGVALRPPAADRPRSRPGAPASPGRAADPARPSPIGAPAPSRQAPGARQWPVVPSRPGPATLPSAVPAAGSPPRPGSVRAPVPSDLPAHATPDVYPAISAPTLPDTPAVPETGPGMQAPAPPGTLSAPVPPPPAGTAGAPRVEIAHDSPAQRSLPRAQTPPASFAPSWSAPARPLGPAPQVVPSAAPESGTEHPAALAADADPAADAVPAADAMSAEDAVPAPADAVPAADAVSAEDAAPDAAPAPADAVPVPAPADAVPAEELSEVYEVSEPEGAEVPEAASGVAIIEPDAGDEAQEPSAAVAVEDPPAPVEALSSAPTQGPSAPQAPSAPVEVLPPAPPAMPAVTAVTGPQHGAVPSIERALSGPSRDRNLSWHGKVKIVAGTGQGPGKRDQEALDRARARLPLKTPKRVLVLGCTSGAGQTLTTLMTGHILASLREEPVAAVDLHDGALGRHSAPAAWLEDVLSGKPPQNAGKARPDGLHPTPKTTPGRLDVIASRDPLRDGDEMKLAVQLNRHYSLAMLDPGAAGLMRLLMFADQLIVVVPASVEGAGALADTRDWLAAHGFAELAAHSVTVINGVSRRSLPDVANAESVARGRCRAIVRVPWDDLLPVGGVDPSALRPQTRVAFTALAGVLVAGLAAEPVRRRQQEKW